jgi:hypothetical protein
VKWGVGDDGHDFEILVGLVRLLHHVVVICLRDH